MAVKMAVKTVPVRYAKVTTSVMGDHGLDHRLVQGAAWYADDPVVRAHPELFSFQPDVVVMTSQGPRRVDELD